MMFSGEMTSNSGSVSTVPLDGAVAAMDVANAAAVKLGVPVSAISGYARHIDNLVITLTNGEQIVLVGYFADSDGQDAPKLEVLDAQGDGYVEVLLSGDAAQGGVSTSVAGAGFGGLGSLGLAGLGLVAAGGLVIAAAADDGNNGGGGNKDTVPPNTPNTNPTDGKSISGTAEPGSTVLLDIHNDGSTEVRIPVPGSGEWVYVFEPPLKDDTTIAVRAEDNAGNTSNPEIIATNDGSRPDAPTVEPSNGKTVTGTASHGTRVEIDTDGDGKPDAVAEVNPDGTWSHSFDPQLPDNTTVTVKAVVGKNSSTPVTITTDGQIPDAPEVNPTNGSSLSGFAEANADVDIHVDINNDGKADHIVPVGADGKWSVDLDPPLANGTEIEVFTRDKANNVSDPVTVVTDSVAPNTPNTNPTDGTTISGTAEPGSTVLLDIDDNGSIDVRVPVDGSGDWSHTFNPALPDDTKVAVKAEDAAGNVSDPEVIATNDGSRPDAPTVEPSNGKEVTGTATTGSTIEIDTNGDGKPDATATVNPDGTWSHTFDPQLPNDTTITVTAVNDKHDASTPVTITTDSLIPDAPTVNPTDGKSLSGFAEANAEVDVYIDQNRDGIVDYIAPVNAQGEWFVEIDPPLANGTEINVYTRDKASNVSDPVTVVTDSSAPPAVVVDSFSPAGISGQAEAGAVVTATDKDTGAVLGTATADAEGKWSFTPEPAPADGQTVSFTAKDAAGNTSEPVDIMGHKGVAIVDFEAGYGGSLYIFAQKTDGTFTTAPTKLKLTNDGNLLGNDTWEITKLFDIDGDGLLDIFHMEDYQRGAAKGTYVYFGNGAGSFDAEPVRQELDLSGGFSHFEYTDVADLNNDGFADIVDFNSLSNGTSGVFNVYLGAGDGTFSGTPNHQMTFDTTDRLGDSTSESTQLIDVNNDGKIDILHIQDNIIAADQGTWVYLGNGKGEFSEDPIRQGLDIQGGNRIYWEFLTGADVNGDGFVDILDYSGGNTGQALRVYLGKGDGKFEDVPIETRFDQDNALGNDIREVTLVLDVNDDGDVDLLHMLDVSTGAAAQGTYIYLGDGKGSFDTAPIRQDIEFRGGYEGGVDFLSAAEMYSFSIV